MGERKVLNKYYPPDFDPAEMPRGKRAANNEKKVRMMLPMSVRCNTCGNFMYKGTKFNCRMEDVQGENYLGLRIFRFYYRCTACAAEFCMKTDPASTDYIMEQGATRNYEPWRDQDVAVAEAVKTREEEEMGNAMKALENRTLDSKREMDIMAALDEVQSLNSRHNKVTTEDALAALQREAARNQQELENEELEDLKEFYRLKKERQLGVASVGAASSAGGAGDVLSAAGDGRGSGGRPSGVMLASLGVSSSDSDEEGLPGRGKGQGAGGGVLGKRAVAGVGELESMPPPPQPSRPSMAAKIVTAPKPQFKVVAKPKAAPVTSATPGPDKSSGGLSGLLGGYGSSGSDGSP